jgi:hypothetical protein
MGFATDLVTTPLGLALLASIGGGLLILGAQRKTENAEVFPIRREYDIRNNGMVVSDFTPALKYGVRPISIQKTNRRHL